MRLTIHANAAHRFPGSAAPPASAALRRVLGRRVLGRSVLGLLVLAVAAIPASAQIGGGGGGVGGGGGGTIGDSQLAGVAIDADGVMRMKLVNDPTGQLTKQRMQQAIAGFDRDLAKPSEMRKVSLNRLEKAVAAKLQAGEQPNAEMLGLAGLTRIQYVFFYPESGDIVVAGPAEPWAEMPTGRMQGVMTGKPIVELRDLVVALRAFSPDGKKTDMVYCSIDPTQEGLARMQQFLSRVGRQLNNHQQGGAIARGLQQSLGHNEITIGGISPSTHFAEVLVEADYRMKLIGIGLERPRVKNFKAWVDRVNPAQVAKNALQRWYFVPNYDCVKASDDYLAMVELVGNGVKLVGEDEVVAQDGRRAISRGRSVPSQRFVEEFTRRYPDLAEASPVYAQLRNCIDMLVAAAYVQERGFYEKSGWDLGVFADEATFQVEIGNPPERVEAAVNAIWKRNRLMTPIGGGVQIRPTKALSYDHLQADEDGTVSEARTKVQLDKLAADQWWWD